MRPTGIVFVFSFMTACYFLQPAKNIENNKEIMLNPSWRIKSFLRYVIIMVCFSELFLSPFLVNGEAEIDGVRRSAKE